nr:MAG TPA: hypothetical protein [Caudoviricetes sp.]
MFQKKNEKELENLKPEELAAHQKELMVRKAELLQKKKDGVIADEEQAELEDLAVYLVTVGKLVKKPTATEKPEQLKPEQTKPDVYVPLKGEENVAVLSLTKGRRFNPDTGEREAPVFTQKFSASEYRLFMAHYKSLGYTIEKVIYNPFEK